MRHGRNPRLAACVAALALCCIACVAVEHGDLGAQVIPVSARAGSGPRVLVVVAHPDDEIAFAGVLYKTATLLDGTCDVLTITDGAAGYRYATLAEPLYGLRLTDPAVARRELPEIRQRELQEGCRSLHVRRIWWLGQPDTGYSLDPAAVLASAGGWDVPAVLASIGAILRAERYDFVLTHAPVPDTHGHHQAATLLALRAVMELDAGARPLVLGVRFSGADGADPAPFAGMPGEPATRQLPERFVFDRAQKFGYRERLDYSIVVNQAIAAHRSQGTMQMLAGAARREHYFAYALHETDALARARALFAALARPQHVVVEAEAAAAPP